MFNAYDYFRSLEEQSGLPVYRVTGLTKLEELVSSVGDTLFPCIAVDYGIDGILDLEDGCFDHGYYTIYILDTIAEDVVDKSRIFSVLDQTLAKGKELMRTMTADRLDDSSLEHGPTGGFQSTTIRYSAIGPIGLQAYGYIFNFEIKRDYE